MRAGLAAVLAALAAVPLVLDAQERDAVGLAIVQACGAIDERAEGVLSGTVRDAETRVGLSGANVALRWGASAGVAAGSAMTRTDGEGFYLFCHVPGGVRAELEAEVLERRSAPAVVEVEAGTLAVEHVLIEVSDPSEPGFVMGRVLDRATREPVASARVSVPERGLSTLSNEHGYFRLDAMPYGVYALEVEHLAYAKRSEPLRVAGGLTQNVIVELAPEALEVKGLTVTVESRRFFNDMDGLVRRMNQGFGDFLTRTDIEERAAGTLPYLLTGIPGVRVAENGRSLVVRGRACMPMVFVDGRQFRLDDAVGLNEILATDLEAVEFYKGTAAVPAEFNRSTNGQVGCGVVVVWTRRGR